MSDELRRRTDALLTAVAQLDKTGRDKEGLTAFKDAMARLFAAADDLRDVLRGEPGRVDAGREDTA